MSILFRLKNKLNDPSLYEMKIREFDECMSILKTENVELHKRIDQLEALCKTSINTQQIYYLEEYIKQLEQENGRLFKENQCQRLEYERFLDQLTTMIVRTAMMQENIRKECASIYHVIERLSNLQSNSSISTCHPFEFLIGSRKKCLSWENLNRSSLYLSKITEQLIRSSSSTSSTTHCSISTSDSWTFDLSFDHIDPKPQLSVLNNSKEEQEQVLLRSETFTISKLPIETLSIPMTGQSQTDKNHKKSDILVAKSTNNRPSRLPARCSNLKTQTTITNTNNTNNRSLSSQKVSKLPIRTTSSLNRQSTSTKSCKISTTIAFKSNKSIVPPKRTIRPPTNVQNSTKVNKTTSTKLSNLAQQINSMSSESSNEEQQQETANKLLAVVQDEGYSTWSSIDVKDDVTKTNLKIDDTNDRQMNMGLVKNWLDTSDKQNNTIKPVNDVEIDKLEEFTQQLNDNSLLLLCPFVRNRCSNGTSMTMLSENKDISLDSLDNAAKVKDHDVTTSSNVVSRSETFETIVDTEIAPLITENTDDDVDVPSLKPTMINKHNLTKPQKRLLIPGLLNRLILFRRVLSDSDLKRKEYSIDESERESQYHVYHSNTINEHSVEVNLINTYGSETELHVWSHDYAEQRRFLNERQQQQQMSNENNDQKLALERQILLQQIYEYPWLVHENDFEPTSTSPTLDIEQSLLSPTPDIIVPSHNPNFYQLCTLPNSGSFVITISPATSTCL